MKNKNWFLPRLLLFLFALSSSIPRAQSQELWPELSRPPKALGGGENDAAVVVGIENYLMVAKIPGARQNAQDWQAYLTDTLKVPPEKIALLRDNEATLEKVRKFAAQKAAEVRPGGTLWFIFVGHGAPSKDGKDGVLIGADAQQDADGLYARSLPRAELLSTLSKGRQAKTLVLLDACFSGRSPSGEALVAGLQPLLVTSNLPGKIDDRVILLTAAKADQFAGPLPKSGTMRPAFSYLALGALRGWAADAEGRVTAAAVVDFARRALMLEKGRTQTPELTEGTPGAVLSLGKEPAPDLGKIDREGGGRDFQVSDLPAVPIASAPKSLDAKASGLDFGNVDVDALEKYDKVVKLDKSDASPEEKASAWTELAVEAPIFAKLAAQRAGDWSRFAEQKNAEKEALEKRISARDTDWKKLSRLLNLDVVPDSDKKKWVGLFLKSYQKSPGLHDITIYQFLQYLPENLDKETTQEFSIREKLGAMRLANAIFYGDHEGNFPARLTELLARTRYLKKIPILNLPNHPPTQAVLNFEGEDSVWPQLKDTGKWLYVGKERSAYAGQILIDCTHTDSKGHAWSSY